MASDSIAGPACALGTFRLKLWESECSSELSLDDRGGVFGGRPHLRRLHD